MGDDREKPRRSPARDEASRLEGEALRLASEGQYEEAAPLYARAIEIAEATDHYALSVWRSAYAQVLGALGRVDDSVEQHRQAVADAVRQDGSKDSSTVIVARYFLAEYLVDQGMYEAALEAVAPSLGSTARVRYVLSVPHALALWRTGHPREARDAAARAMDGAANQRQRESFAARLEEILDG